MGLFIGISQVTRCCRQDAAFAGGVTFLQFMILDAVAKKKEPHSFKSSLIKINI
jgi:hypothetical protein